jgi:hypothetical protein
MQRADLRGALAHLVFLGAARHPGEIEFDNENAHAAFAGGLVGAGKNKANIPHRSVVDPEF